MKRARPAAADKYVVNPESPSPKPLTVAAGGRSSLLKGLHISEERLAASGGTRPDLRSLSAKLFFARKLARDYLLTFSYGADAEAPDGDPGGDEYDEEGLDEEGLDAGDPNAYITDLAADIIHIPESRFVGTALCEIIDLEFIAALFHPDEIYLAFDGERADRGEMIHEVITNRRLKHWLRDPRGTLLHVDSISLGREHRGRDLGLACLKRLIEDAHARAGCNYAILCPSPLPSEEGDAGHGRSVADGYDREKDPEFIEATRKLFAYYERLGVARPTPRSTYLTLELAQARKRRY